MDNFTFCLPTEIVFGAGAHKDVGARVRRHADKILLVRLSAESLRRIGIYDDIVDSLRANGVAFTELEGIRPNPRLSKVREGVGIVKGEGIGFILAVGGGSVLDTAKAIAAGACTDADYWDIVTGKVPFEKALPYATVLTYPATGSEMNASCVITDDETGSKRGFDLSKPAFSLLNPEVSQTLPKKRKAQGVVDMLAHAMERYFTNTEGIELTDRMLEGVMKTIVHLGPKYCEGYDYQTASQIMYSATVAHNFSLCVGRVNDFASHQISHELSGMYDLSHGEALSVIFPAWLKYNRAHNRGRFVQFFVNVFNVAPNFLDQDETIDRGIAAIEDFYKSLDMPVRISETPFKTVDAADLADRATLGGSVTVGNYVKLAKDDIIKIYELAK